jgi:ethanolamine utilization protein EutA (predicted chaperonin)
MKQALTSSLQSCIDELNQVIKRMAERDEVSDGHNQFRPDALALLNVRGTLDTLMIQRTPLSRVLVTVSGGVADCLTEGPVAVEVFDFDDYEAVPEETGLPSAEFLELARQSDDLASLIDRKTNSGKELIV